MNEPLSYDVFVERVGLLRPFDRDATSSEAEKALEGVLKEKGLFPAHSNGMFETYQLPELRNFIQEHPEYHIVTEVDDGVVLGMDNAIRFVNRTGYYLACGDADFELFMVEE